MSPICFIRFVMNLKEQPQAQRKKEGGSREAGGRSIGWGVSRSHYILLPLSIQLPNLTYSTFKCTSIARQFARLFSASADSSSSARLFDDGLVDRICNYKHHPIPRALLNV